jgi:hypothetical protein
MKRIIVSAGVVALGAAGAHAAASLPGFASPEAASPWSVALTLRGFYDDNPSTQPTGPTKKDSFGFQVNPSLRLSQPGEQTSMSLAYDYSFKDYENKPVGNDSHYDQSHTFTAALTHAFDERYQFSVADSFVIGQEPDMLRAGSTYATFQRIPGDNIVNYGTITFNGQLTQLFGLELGYANTFYDWSNKDPLLNANGDVIAASLSGLMDRIGHLGRIDSRWQVFPDTIGVVGYAYAQDDYTGDEAIAGNIFGVHAMSSVRNSRSHYGYVGVDHSFRSDLKGLIRGGVRHTDFYNDPDNQNGVTPYVEAKLSYAYTKDSQVSAGFKYDRSPTDRFSVQGLSITTDAQAAYAFASVRHQIMPDFYANLTGEFQNSDFNGGSFDGKTEQYYLAGLNLEYHFPHERMPPFLTDFSVEAGYNFDRLDSDIPNGSYSRNRVYLGFSGRY